MTPGRDERPAHGDGPYNPLDKRHLGESVCEALLRRPVQQLPPEGRVVGAGGYAIYYAGSFPLYSAIAARNREQRWEAPIYVGKAIPPGGRKGGVGVADSPVLSGRLQEHAESVRQATNLDLADFACRFLIVDDIWIPLGESLLIQQFEPVWNIALDGFGNHDPGSGRHKQQRSPWDVLHPGRPWAERLQPNRRSLDEIVREVGSFINRPTGDEPDPEQ